MNVEHISFMSGNERCHGSFFPAQTRSEYCIVMGGGLAGVKEMRQPEFAEVFSRAGYNVVTFDYRHFGESEGEPRQILSIKKQHQDWLAAIKFAQQEKGFSLSNTFIWGTSLSGGHVFEIAHRLPEIAGVISQVPHVSGMASIAKAGLVKANKLTLAALWDRLRSLAGLTPYYLKATGLPGEFALITGKGEQEGYASLVPEGMEFDNRVAARFAMGISFYNPGTKLPKLTMPVLVQVALADITTPPEPAINFCKKAEQQGVDLTLRTHDCGHFDPYIIHFDAFVAEQLAFMDSVISRQPEYLKAG